MTRYPAITGWDKAKATVIRDNALRVVTEAANGRSFNEQQQAALDKFFSITDDAFWMQAQPWTDSPKALFGLIARHAN